MQQKTETRGIFPNKTPQKFHLPIIRKLNFQINQLNNSPANCHQHGFQYFKLRAILEINYQFILDEDIEMETQPTYLSSNESENATPCSSPGYQLRNNVPDTHGAIMQLILSQQELMSYSGKLALKYPPTPPTSLISDENDDEVFTPPIGNPTQNVPYIPKRRPRPHPLQLCQEPTPIPDTPESPTPENRGQPDLFRP